MFRLMLQKITHKKWMILCLLIGNILLIAVAICNPMYQKASGQRMLTDEFEMYQEENDTWPALISLGATSDKKDRRDLVEKINTYFERNLASIDIPVVESIEHFSVIQSKIKLIVERSDASEKKVSIGMVSDLKEHTNLLAGEMYSDTIAEDGCVEAVITQTAMVSLNLLVGEEIEFVYLTDAQGNTIHVRITGVIGAGSSSDPYWAFDLENKNEIYISEQVFEQMFRGEQEEKFNVRCNWYKLLDYKAITPEDIPRILKASDILVNQESFGALIDDVTYESLLDSYNAKAKTNEATFTILQVPLLLLLCAFLFMISRQMLTMEQNEISLMKSRGAKRLHIICLYLLQSLFLSAISFVIALPLGRGICKMLGSATAFLEFSAIRELNITYDVQVLKYAFLAIGVSIIMTVLPVIRYSGISIVNLKQNRARSKKPLWQKLFLDIVCLGVAYYGYYTFSKSHTSIKQNVMAGESLDPLLYMCSSLFILGAGFLFLRIQPLIIKLIYKVFRRKMGPVGFSSFLSAIRSGAKQHFIMMFMILTVALGLFHATVARTILNNAQTNERYLAGADFAIQEKWKDNRALVAVDPTLPLEYYEPDYNRFKVIDGVKSSAQVLLDQGTYKTKDASEAVNIMGIVPKDFADVTSLDNDLLYYKYYDYLTVLASDSDGVLVSENFMTNLGCRLGDGIVFKNSAGDSVYGKIRGFITYWPTYTPTYYTVGEDGSVNSNNNYMIVANLDLIQEYCDVTPYQVWMKLEDTSQCIYDWVNEKEITVTSYNDLTLEEKAITEDNLFQGTNGILTLSFIVILILCAVGYLIYWIMSIRSRELLFGVLRAMGMGKSQIIRMLVLEQIFCGFSSIFVGAIIGCIASYLYVPMIQYAYASENQILPLQLVANVKDIAQLFSIIFIVLIICLVVLARIISKMNISKALKLGED